MTEQPYTDADLRVEAARQYAALLEDPDFGGVGEQMEDQEVIPGGGVVWDDFSTETYEKAQRAIHKLIGGAADVSEWAVNLGADDLKPVNAVVNIKDSAGHDRVRLHFAFAPDMDDDTRKTVMELAAEAIRRT